ncbi:MAG TPA: hypothetical protein DDW54_04365 [Clostridiales bacterium]|nr:hypothetical protein [Clostridiales bacterium]
MSGKSRFPVASDKKSLHIYYSESKRENPFFRRLGGDHRAKKIWYNVFIIPKIPEKSVKNGEKRKNYLFSILSRKD